MSDDDAPRMPYYAWYVVDYRASFKVQRLTWRARGLYREILDECWVRGHVPDDLNELALICRCDIKDIAEHWRYIKPLLREVPQSDGHLFESPRMEVERANLDALRARRAAAGRKGGMARRSNDLEAMLSNAKQSDHIRSEQTKAVGGALRRVDNCNCQQERHYAPGTGTIFYAHADSCPAKRENE